MNLRYLRIPAFLILAFSISSYAQSLGDALRASCRVPDSGSRANLPIPRSSPTTTSTTRLRKTRRAEATENGTANERRTRKRRRGDRRRRKPRRAAKPPRQTKTQPRSAKSKSLHSRSAPRRSTRHTWTGSPPYARRSTPRNRSWHGFSGTRWRAPISFQRTLGTVTECPHIPGAATSVQRAD